MKTNTAKVSRFASSTSYAQKLRRLTVVEALYDWHCADCGAEHRRVKTNGQPHSYCRLCKNRRQRESRKRHSELTPEQRMRANSRSYANVSLRRGLIVKKPCEGIRNGRRCMRRKVQMHHDDYSKPTVVRFLCDECHRAHHREHG